MAGEGGAGGEPEDSAVLWTPSSDRIAEASLTHFAQWVVAERGAPPEAREDYAALHRWSIEAPEAFWLAVWDWVGIVSEAGPTPEGSPSLLLPEDDRPGFGPDHRPRWFPGARLNFAENLLRPAATGRAEAPALRFWDERGHQGTLTFRALEQAVARFARRLEAEGIGSGDRVVGFLPNLPETVIAFLGCATVGAIWSSCSPDFGTEAVVDRFGQIEPRLLVAATGYRYKGKAIGLEGRISEIAARLPTLTHLVLIAGAESPEPQGSGVASHAQRIHWADWMGTSEAEGSGADEAREIPPYRALPFDHPLVILYSSGTTGLPKCIVHSAGGTLLQHRKEHRLQVDLRPGDRFFYFTTCGWMMWNWLVTGLAEGATLVLYDGAPALPDRPDLLWAMAEAEGIEVFGVSARYLALMEKEGVEPGREWDLSALRTILSTGSPLAPASFDWVYGHVKADLHLASISGGTDIVSCFMGGIPTLPVRRGEIQGPGLGMAVEIREAEDPEGPLGPRIRGQPGELVCTRPFPSMPLHFWEDPGHERYARAYFERSPGLWCHGDWAEETAAGGYRIHGRSDATLNPGGVRIGTAELYRQVETFDEILESVAVGREIPGGGPGDVEIALFLKLREGVMLTEALEGELRRRIREHASPHHVPRLIRAVPDLPRTVSGKLSEIAVREQIHGRPVKNLDALANPESLGPLAPTLPPVLEILLGEVVDYAGLFPPAGLPMEEAVANYARYRTGGDRWALGRFVVPSARLEAFQLALAPHLEAIGAEDPWELSVLLGPDPEGDLAQIRELEDASGGRVRVSSIEARIQRPEDAARMALAVAPIPCWLEIPLLELDGAVAPVGVEALRSALVPYLQAIRDAGARAKVRTGGITPELFPDPEALLTFLEVAVAMELPFKATAGLHHPLRGRYPLTYEAGAPREAMFGYLNVLLATLWLRNHPGDRSGALELLLLEDPRTLRAEGTALVWRGVPFELSALEALRREGLVSFGSCSLREPVDELAPFRVLA
jgi:acetoacetyl-CoA synthetase